MEQLGAFLPLILIFIVFWVLLIRPQQKKMKQHRDMINNLKKGDKIVTSGGIIGTIIKINDNKDITVEISDNVNVQVATGMVAELVNTSIQNKNTQVINSDNKNSGFFSKIFNNKNKK